MIFGILLTLGMFIMVLNFFLIDGTDRNYFRWDIALPLPFGKRSYRWSLATFNLLLGQKMELVVVGQDFSKIKTAAGIPTLYDVLLQQHLVSNINGRF